MRVGLPSVPESRRAFSNGSDEITGDRFELVRTVSGLAGRNCAEFNVSTFGATISGERDLVMSRCLNAVPADIGYTADPNGDVGGIPVTVVSQVSRVHGKAASKTFHLSIGHVLMPAYRIPRIPL